MMTIARDGEIRMVCDGCRQEVTHAWLGPFVEMCGERRRLLMCDRCREDRCGRDGRDG